jgi:hypothetical protein
LSGWPAEASLPIFGRVLGPKALEFVDRGLIGAVMESIPRSRREVRVSDFGGLAERHVLIELESAIHGTLPELGVGLGQTPKLPIVADEAG